MSSTDIDSGQEYADDDMDILSSDYSIKDEPISPTNGLLDRTRIALCVFMFAVLAFNPFGILFDQSFGGGMNAEDGFKTSGTGRSILGEPGKYWSIIKIVFKLNIQHFDN